MKKRVSVFLAAAVMMAAYTLAGAEAADGWTCENGHEGNTGKFCIECGAAKPAEAETWTCENGHEGNTGNFCAECGAPKPAVSEEWTCENGHEGNTGKFCIECGAPKPAVTYDNPFPASITSFNKPFEGLLIDHQVAIAEVLSHVDPADEHYVAYEGKGIASEQLAWEKYTGPNHDLYMVYQNGGKEMYAYVYVLELDESQRTNWAAGELFPNLLNAVSSVLWVESGEDNDVYSRLLDEAAKDTDYEGVQKLMRLMDPKAVSTWFSHKISMFSEELGNGKDRYWVVYHNTDVL